MLAVLSLAGALLMAQSGDVVPIPPPKNGITTSNDAAFRRVSNRLLCQCGCSYMVLDCNMVDCPSAGYIRKTVQSSLAEGKSEDAIIAGFVQQYGPRILPEPPRYGFSLSAWVMPFVVLILGAALASYVLWQWKFKVGTAAAGVAPGSPAGDMAAPQQASAALVEKYRAEIDRELEKE